MFSNTFEYVKEGMIKTLSGKLKRCKSLTPPERPAEVSLSRTPNLQPARDEVVLAAVALYVYTAEYYMLLVRQSCINLCVCVFVADQECQCVQM